MKFKIKRNFLTLCMICYSFLHSNLQAQSLQVETLTIGGPYAGLITSPFNGVAFYGNGDKTDGTITLTNATGLYDIAITGASSGNSNAQIDLYVGGSKVGTFSFNSAIASTDTKSISITSTGTNKTIQLLLATDTGSNDTFVDKITFTYQGTPSPPRMAPVLPTVSAFDSGVYRNMFVESGKNATAVTAKLDQMWNQYFVNGDANSGRLLYNVGTDMAYVLDTGNDDIRSEGMSYGMMIAVQMDKKAEFDKLWKFAKTYSQHPVGDVREGLFSWRLNRSNFSKIDPNSAPDGEEYYVTALFFAHARWGSAGAFNYRAEADYILDSMLNKPSANSGGCPTDLVDTIEKQVVFGICGSSATFTDPSYHLPAFYEIWARYAKNNKTLWAEMADKSRTYLLPRAAHPVTGLMPDYSEFNGTPKNEGDHGKFEYDAWRNIMNMGADQAWFKKSSIIITPLINRQIDFFKGKPNYAALWTLDGSVSRTNDHSPGLVGCNAVGSLALADAKVWPFIDELFDTAIPSGQYRYYDGLLYMMSYMHLSGNFKAYKLDGIPIETFTITASAGANGAISPTGAVVVSKNTDKTFTITPNTGYVVNTLTVNGAVVASGNSYAFTNVTANQTIVATFKVKPPVETFTITASAGTNGTISPTGAVVVDKNTDKTFTITPNVGYVVNTITVNGAVVASGNNYTFTNVTANQTIVATFKVKLPVETFIITASAGENGTISPTGAVIVDKNTDKTFAITPNAGYVVNTITVNGAVVASANNYTFTNVIANQTIAVTFKVIVVGNNCLLTRFGVPRSNPLPTINVGYTKVFTIGSNVPNLSNVNNASFNWALSSGNVWDFSVNITNGVPSYYVDLRNSVQNFGQAQPAITFNGTGIVNLDGNKYYANIVDSNNLVFVEVSGKHAIYFSKSTVAPAGCVAARFTNFNDEDLKILSNPVSDLLNINVPGKLKIKQVIVYDLSGRVLLEKDLDTNSEQTSIDVSGLPSGFYKVVFNSDNKNWTKNIIKE
jgi:endo-1,4-beta-D-glucanase Y